MVSTALSGHANSHNLQSVCPAPVVAPTTAGAAYTGEFLIFGKNFHKNDVVTTDGPLRLKGTPIVDAAGTLIRQKYEIRCCEPREGQKFHLYLNPERKDWGQIEDRIVLSGNPPLYNLCRAHGSWKWTAKDPYCPSSGCFPEGSQDIGADLWNLAGASGSSQVEMSFKKELKTKVSFAGAVEKSPVGRVVGYPNLNYGYQPLGCSAPPCPAAQPTPLFPMPVQVSSLPELWALARYSIHAPPDTSLNLAYDIWITQGNRQAGICKDDVELEIIIFRNRFYPGDPKQGEPFPLPAWINGELRDTRWQAYVGQSGTGQGKSCQAPGNATTVWLVLQDGLPNAYVGVSISRMIEAMTNTLAGVGWDRDVLRQYWVNNIALGSEFACPLENTQCEKFRVKYSYTISNFCLREAPAKGDAGGENWRPQPCPEP
jgi:hypothetical protein